MITLYDLRSTLDDGNPSTSPFVWRTRFALQLKGLPFTTRFVEYSEIPAAAKEVGALPTTVHPDGTPKYTVPMIYDSTTNTAVADSFLIAKYLDHTYPNSGPTLVPENTEVLQSIFAADTSMALLRPLFQVLQAIVYSRFGPSMQKQYRDRAPSLDPDVKFDEKDLAERWSQFEMALGTIDRAMGDKNTLGKANEPTFADTALGASLQLVKLVFGADSQQWKTISSWHNGRWEKYLDGLDSANSSSVKTL